MNATKCRTVVRDSDASVRQRDDRVRARPELFVHRRTGAPFQAPATFTLRRWRALSLAAVGAPTIEDDAHIRILLKALGEVLIQLGVVPTNDEDMPGHTHAYRRVTGRSESNHVSSFLQIAMMPRCPA